MKLLRKFCAEQVNILLDRMESHPEEFYKTLTLSASVFDGKWDFVLSSGEFTRIEKFLIKSKMKELKREATHRQILMTIMYGREEGASDPYDPVRMSTTSRFTKEEQTRHMIASKEMVEQIKKFQKELRK